MKNNIKLIATDLDGTLLNDDTKITDYNKYILKKLADKGIEIVIATGRPISAMDFYYKELQNNSESIVFNGAMIVDKKLREVVINYTPLHKLLRRTNLNLKLHSRHWKKRFPCAYDPKL